MRPSLHAFLLGMFLSLVSMSHAQELHVGANYHPHDTTRADLPRLLLDDVVVDAEPSAQARSCPSA